MEIEQKEIADLSWAGPVSSLSLRVRVGLVLGRGLTLERVGDAFELFGDRTYVGDDISDVAHRVFESKEEHCAQKDCSHDFHGFFSHLTFLV